MTKENFEQEEVKEIGKIERKDSSDIIVRKTKFKGNWYFDIRHWVETEKYTGWTKKGICLPMENLEELIKILQKMVKK
jgi:hypothetical protein